MAFVRRRVGKTGMERFLRIYIDLDGEERSSGSFSTEKQALREAQRVEDKLAEGLAVDRHRGKQPFGDYVIETWFPNHMIEHSTRQNYAYLLDAYILPRFGGMRIGRIRPGTVREWVTELQAQGINPPTIRQCKIILDAVFSTAHNDQITFLHAGRGVKTPPVAKKLKRIITFEQFEAIYRALPDDKMRLLVETDIESGLRWGELTELRVRDLNFGTGMLTVSRAVVKLNPNFHPEGKRFLVKNYPKDKEWRQFELADHLVGKLAENVKRHDLGPDDLLFEQEQPTAPRRITLPEVLPDPDTLGRTEPNAKGRTYKHGTTSAYSAAGCRCQHCHNAVAAYRASRRGDGEDSPRPFRVVDTDGHLSNDWFRNNVWNKAVAEANIGVHVTPHGMRAAHASWLLAGGADVQLVKERLGHGSLETTSIYLGTLPNANKAALRALDNIRGKRITDAKPASPPTSMASDSEKDRVIEELQAKLAKFRALLDED